MRKVIGVLLLLLAPVAFSLVMLEQRLLSARVLNTKDLAPFIGTETGTVTEYLLNVWHWDGVIGLMCCSSLPCLAIGVFVLRSTREKPIDVARPCRHCGYSLRAATSSTCPECGLTSDTVRKQVADDDEGVPLT